MYKVQQSRQDSALVAFYRDLLNYNHSITYWTLKKDKLIRLFDDNDGLPDGNI
jgi:hypothetical protein